MITRICILTLGMLVSIFVLGCASEPGIYDPPTRSDVGYERYLTAAWKGELQKLYLSACGTRHTDSEVIASCWKDQYRAGLQIQQDTVVKRIGLPEVQRCMDLILFPDGTPDLVEIVRKDCFNPNTGVRNQSTQYEKRGMK